MAIENELQRPFRTVRAHFDLLGTHLSRRATWMVLDGPLSWRQRGQPQPIDEAKDFSEQLPQHRHLGRLERDVATVAHDLGPDLDQLLAQRSAANALLPPIRMTSPLGQ